MIREPFLIISLRFLVREKISIFVNRAEFVLQEKVVPGNIKLT